MALPLKNEFSWVRTERAHLPLLGGGTVRLGTCLIRMHIKSFVSKDTKRSLKNFWFKLISPSENEQINDHIKNCTKFAIFQAFGDTDTSKEH